MEERAVKFAKAVLVAGRAGPRELSGIALRAERVAGLSEKLGWSSSGNGSHERSRIWDGKSRSGASNNTHIEVIIS